MAESGKKPGDKIYNANDSLDINELVSLNEDISDDLIEQLQSQIIVNNESVANQKASSSDGAMFEEVDNSADSKDDSQVSPGFNSDIDDNFIKKYKAKLKKKHSSEEEDDYSLPSRRGLEEKQEPSVELPLDSTSEKIEEGTQVPVVESENDIGTISGGNITEKPLTQENLEYKDSLELLDGNTKYSKYVIYIDPENKDFMDSLTVKERKNLINRILREQDSIAVSKIKFGKVQTIITHAVIAILTVVLAIPCIYWAINASLEATINNYRSSQTVFSQLYKQNGKIKTQRPIK